MNITVTVEDLTLATLVYESSEMDGGGVTIADRVVQAVVHRLATDRDREWWGSVRQRIDAIRDEEIRDAVRPLIAEALSRPIQQANPYGEPIGKETTLTAIIVREAQDFMSKKTGDYRNERTVLRTMVAEAVAAAFKDEVADAVKQARDAVAGEIGQQVAASVAAAVQKGLAAR